MILLGWYPILSTVSVDRLQVMASSGSIPSIFRSHSPGHLSKFLGVSIALLVPERLSSIFNCLPQYFFPSILPSFHTSCSCSLHPLLLPCCPLSRKIHMFIPWVFSFLLFVYCLRIPYMHIKCFNQMHSMPSPSVLFQNIHHFCLPTSCCLSLNHWIHLIVPVFYYFHIKVYLIKLILIINLMPF